MNESFYHQPVLLQEVLEHLIVNPGGIYMDMTLGGGGHAYEVLRRLSADGYLVGLDADSDAIKFATEKLAEFENKSIYRSFSDQLDVVLMQADKFPVSGFLFDLGISSFQIDEAAKGFSFKMDGPLDMRFNNNQEKTAAEILHTYDEAKLGGVLRDFGEEKFWRRITRKIIESRDSAKLETTFHLAALIEEVVPARFAAKAITRVFQGIRIEVNGELSRFKTALAKAFDCLEQGGRIVVIAYHSLEDRICKEFFKEKSLDCVCPPQFPQCVCEKEQELKIITRRPLLPSDAEIKLNPRARSAKMRVAEKTVEFKGIV